MTTENAFRSQLNNFGWTRRQEPPVSTQAPSFLDRLNPFSQNGYNRLPTSNNDLPAQLPAPSAAEEEAFFSLSRWDRMIVFAMLVLGAAACFFIAYDQSVSWDAAHARFFFLPILALKPRKFVTLWTVGSLLFISSFAALQGPTAYGKHLISGDRIPFTAAYFGSMILTLYFSIGLNNTLLTLISAAVQIVALLWYLVSYFPGGSTGMRFAGGLVVNRATSYFG
ncbi:Got1/Sft2-like family-domain-containing protein [Protomyces lactucae-debilis]|uniref:Protein transport protein SFT2 n=1 Tax=Protomyces lactucae-debilis TaxID=2754530 RepID=A0A1Y2F2N7_PROLT|nr:Got1/Sft2-like family-domain-containing protein [Protomyces lactucae-debilis]ORY78139.1 Got1/Sft2-like family-domain-containing protein [Protomyces lactucae-debilis]